MGGVLDMSVLDADASGVISRQEFQDWYDEQLTHLIRSPFDMLFGTTRSDAYWWFAQVLWLKLLCTEEWVGRGVPR